MTRKSKKKSTSKRSSNPTISSPNVASNHSGVTSHDNRSKTDSDMLLRLQRAVGNKAVGRFLNHDLKDKTVSTDTVQRFWLPMPIDFRGIFGDSSSKEEEKAPADGAFLLMAALSMVENVGDRLELAIGKKTKNVSGSVFGSMLSILAGATVAGAFAWKISSLIVSEVAEEFVNEMLQGSASESAQAIADGLGYKSSVDPDTFITRWKLEQRKRLTKRALMKHSGSGGKQTELESKLDAISVDPSKLDSVENEVFRNVLSAYMEAQRMSMKKQDSLSGAGYLHIRIGAGASKVHCDLVGVSADNRELSNAVKETGVDPLHLNLPVVLSVTKTPSLGSQTYAYETWWLKIIDRRLWLDDLMMYSHSEVTSRKPSGPGSTRRANGALSGSRLSGYLGRKLPIPTAFGNGVSIKRWEPIN